MTRLTNREVLAAWGESAEGVADGLARFAATTRALSSDKPRLIEKHPQEWVALCDDVEITAPTLDSVLEKMDARGLPRSDTIVRFINAAPKTMIL